MNQSYKFIQIALYLLILISCSHKKQEKKQFTIRETLLKVLQDNISSDSLSFHMENQEMQAHITNKLVTNQKHGFIIYPMSDSSSYSSLDFFENINNEWHFLSRVDSLKFLGWAREIEFVDINFDNQDDLLIANGCVTQKWGYLWFETLIYDPISKTLKFNHEFEKNNIHDIPEFNKKRKLITSCNYIISRFEEDYTSFCKTYKWQYDTLALIKEYEEK